MYKLIILLLLFVPKVFAGTCPSSAVYGPNLNATLSSLGITNCFYISAAGNNSNSGATELLPWLHAPGMSNCSSVCASTTPVGGMGFIFRGGDSWHFGNSSASPYVGGSSPGWNVTWSGSSGSPIYWGVDHTWYSGVSWERPVMTGDNPTSSTGVGACAYDESTYTALNYSSQRYNTFDNLEFTGFCWHGNQSNSNEHICCLYILYGGQGNATPSFNTVQNMYFHGWSHASFSCSLSGGEPTGNCDGAHAIDEGSNSTYGQGDVIANNVFDGSDTDEQSLEAIGFGGYDIHNNVIRYLGNAVVTNNTHVFHDNLLEYLHNSGDNVSHTNASKFNSEWNGVNAFYNNVYRYLWLTGICEVSQWYMPSSTDYVFNNIQYGLGCSANYFDLASTYGTGWTSNIFNNTWQVLFGGGINANPALTTVNFDNMLCIQPGGSGTGSNCYAGAGTINYLTSLVLDVAPASTQYPSSGPFPYTPSGTASGTGAGTNKQSICTTLLGSSDADLVIAGNACKLDSTFGAAYNVTNHTVTGSARTPLTRPISAAWDIGAIQFNGATPPPSPVPPTNLHGLFQ